MNTWYRKCKNTYLSIPLPSRAAIWYAICNFIQKGIIFITTPIFSRLLTKDEFGVFSVFTTWQNIIIIFASLNLASGVYLRGLIKYEDDENEFSSSLYSLFTVIFFGVFVLYLVFSGFWNSLLKLPLPYMLSMFADMLVAVAFHFWSAYQRVHYTYRMLIVVTVANAILRPVAGVIAIFAMQDHVGARIYSMTLMDVICFGWFFITMFYKRHPKISFKYWRYALTYNIPLVPHYLSQIVLNQSDRIMIDRMTGSATAGVYSLAYTVASIMHVVSQAILNSYNPWMYRNIKDEKYEDINRCSLQLLALIAGCNLALIIFAPDLIRFFAPPSYYEAVWIIPPVSMSMFFMFMYSLFANFEFYYEKTKYMMVASVCGAALNVILNYIFIGKYGYMAAGYTTLACYLCYCVAHYLLMRSILKKELGRPGIYNMKIVLAISLAFVVIGFGFMALYEQPVIRYVIMAVAVATVIANYKILLKIALQFKKGKKAE